MFSSQFLELPTITENEVSGDIQAGTLNVRPHEIKAFYESVAVDGRVCMAILVDGMELAVMLSRKEFLKKLDGFNYSNAFLLQ